MAQNEKRLEEVAEIFDDRCGNYIGEDCQLRKGPYQLYTGSSVVPFDDFSFDGTFLLFGTMGNVIGQNDRFNVAMVTGRFSVNDSYHVVACDNADDTEFLGLVAASLSVEGYAEKSGNTTRLSESSLRHIRVPWPQVEVRKAFVDFHREKDQEIKTCTVQAEDLFYQAVDDYRELCDSKTRVGDICDLNEGRFLRQGERTSDGRIPVVSARGIVAWTDEEGIEEPCIVVAQSGTHLLARFMPNGAFPLDDAVALTMKPGSSLSAEELVFALANDGVYPRTHIVDGRIEAPALSLNSVEDLDVAIASADSAEAVSEKVRKALFRIDELKKQSASSRMEVERATRCLLEGSDDVGDALAGTLKNATESSPECLAVDANAPLTVQDAGEANVCPPVSESYSPGAFFEGGDTVDARRAQAALDGAIAQARVLVERKKGEQTPAFDAAWEVMPLLLLRCAPDEEIWKRVVSAEDSASQVDAELLNLAHQKSALQTLENLTSRSSVLTTEARENVLHSLDALPVEALGEKRGAPLRWLEMENITEVRGRGAKASECRVDSPCPEALAGLMARVAKAFCHDPSSIFDPCSKSGEVLAYTHCCFPQASLHAQTGRFTDALAGAMAAFCEGWEFAEGAPQVGDALLRDLYGEAKFDVVVSVLPFDQGQWCTSAPRSDDPRWSFGTPPRTRANLAWLQHAYHHRTEGGVAVLAAGNAILHESRGCEPKIRSKIIDSGCVYVVASLPGGLFDDGRGPMSLIVLGDAREGDAETLFVNASECGTPCVADVYPPKRTLSRSVCERISDVVSTWAQSGRCEAEPSFARVVSKSNLAAVGDLTPWSFV